MWLFHHCLTLYSRSGIGQRLAIATELTKHQSNLRRLKRLKSLQDKDSKKPLEKKSDPNGLFDREAASNEILEMLKLDDIALGRLERGVRVDAPYVFGDNTRGIAFRLQKLAELAALQMWLVNPHSTHDFAKSGGLTLKLKKDRSAKRLGEFIPPAVPGYFEKTMDADSPLLTLMASSAGAWVVVSFSFGAVTATHRTTTACSLCFVSIMVLFSSNDLCVCLMALCLRSGMPSHSVAFVMLHLVGFGQSEPATAPATATAATATTTDSSVALKNVVQSIVHYLSSSETEELRQQFKAGLNAEEGSYDKGTVQRDLNRTFSKSE